jgi:hypothetical protein
MDALPCSPWSHVGAVGEWAYSLCPKQDKVSWTARLKVNRGKKEKEKLQRLRIMGTSVGHGRTTLFVDNKPAKSPHSHEIRAYSPLTSYLPPHQKPPNSRKLVEQDLARKGTRPLLMLGRWRAMSGWCEVQYGGWLRGALTVVGSFMLRQICVQGM